MGIFKNTHSMFHSYKKKSTDRRLRSGCDFVYHAGRV